MPFRSPPRYIAILAVLCIAIASLIFFAFSTGSADAQWLPDLPDLKPLNPFKDPPRPFTPPPTNPDEPDLVKLDYLSVRPHKSEKNQPHVKYYWNIPYAASAYGKNRFRGPQPPGKYEETLEWSGKLGICPRIQKINETLRNRKDVSDENVRGIDTGVTEDCLSLNVFAPIDAKAGDDLPVLVNIPGGGFHIPGRSNAGEMVEKSRIEKDGKVEFKGMVTITMYYRNGIYGFLSGKEIQKDGDFNNGVRDQRAALEWVQKYIRYFGGNPDRVVVMGTSAGGASALMHLTANGGDNSFMTPGTGNTKLFHGVIAQSPASPTFYTPEQAEKFWEEVALGVNCTDLSVECVRNASVGDLYFQNYPMTFPGRNTPPRWMWAPTTEPKGGMLTEPATSALIGGRYAKIPTIFGYTTNEGSDQVAKETDTVEEMKSYLKDHYPLLTDADLDLLVKTYPNDRHWPDSGRYWDAVAKAQGDIRYICPTYLASNAMAGHNPQDVKTWQYQWDVAAEHDMKNGYGTKHAGSVGLVMSRPMNPISYYFISFVKHLDPNTERDPKTPKWPNLDIKDPKRVMFSNREGEGGMKAKKQEVTVESPDEARERRCRIIYEMAPRLQQAPSE
ncbi:alpha/beta-hydrolase [Sporormia fimetaria CBS 119925]|uniref:Carboxylic ester hydrolase n=1 Tax=Sporormia fimetaria CBS 119925 TaxID=1340428 RepID=A0A6A6UVH1_9PLEO|nr:alpha/beta-hydrolase [Sporormia fimetaria CBS 119925]